MNKSEFTAEVRSRMMENGVSVSHEAAAAAVDAALKTISIALQRGDDVVFSGFGKFEVRHRNARRGTNPKTGERVDIAARKVPAFKAGSVLKEEIAESWQRL